MKNTDLRRHMLEHYRDSAADYTHTYGYSAAAHKTLTDLIDAGMIDERDDTDRDSGLVITAAGLDYLSTLGA